MNDDFEKRLQRQPPRALPPAWRAEILVAADVSRRKSPLHASLLHQLYSALRTPHTAFKWSALAAAWVVIFLLNHASRDTSPEVTAQIHSSPRQIQTVLQERKKLFAELGDPASEAIAPERPKPAPRPHSQRRSTISAA